jgi:hypothetical protein
MSEWISWRRTFVVVIEVEKYFKPGTSREEALEELEREARREKTEGGGYLIPLTYPSNDCRHPEENTEASGPNGCFMKCNLCGKTWND